MRVLMVCDHYPVSPRVNKMRNTILKLYPSADVRVFVWNRLNKPIKEKYIYSFNQNIGYGNRFLKLINLTKLILNLRSIIKQFSPTHIHAIDVEMMLISALSSRKNKLIYEVYDLKFFNNIFFTKFREFIEFGIIKILSPSIILASPFFYEYYEKNGIYLNDYIVINNKPLKETFNNQTSSYMDNFHEKVKDKIVISFIGTVRYESILRNLIEVSKEFNEMIILIAGDGPGLKYIERYVDINKLEDKVIITGRFQENDLKSIYLVSDVIWAAYPGNDKNVTYAMSNKYFESLTFNKKIIVTEKTALGELVENEKCGYIVNPLSSESIRFVLNIINTTNDSQYKLSSDHKLYWENEEDRVFKIYT